MARPQLPVKYANPKIRRILDTAPPPQVKYQMLNCQGKEILVGRLKVETPTESGHAFILRRFDTGAVSLTTMFRAAFPLASELEERAELQWIKENYDLSGNNGSSKEAHITRLAGTWVNPVLALELGDQYALGPLIKIVVDAQPDPNATYRRSAKAAAAAAAADVSPAPAATVNIGISHHPSNSSVVANAGSMHIVATKSLSPSMSVASIRTSTGPLPTPSPTTAQPNPPKRRKESSPAPQAARSVSPPLKPRRSARTKSPAPKPVQTLTSVKTPPRSPKKRVEHMTPSDKTVVDEDGDKIEKLTTTELHDQDILEQKKLIEDLKAQREAKEKEEVQEDAGDEDDDGGMDADEDNVASKKRARDEGEPEYKFEFKEPEVGERAIATNSRVRFQMEPRTRSFAWGVAAFAVGMSVVSLLPNLL